MARRPLEREQVYLDGGRRTTQLMRDSLGGDFSQVASVGVTLPATRLMPLLVSSASLLALACAGWRRIPTTSDSSLASRQQVQVWQGSHSRVLHAVRLTSDSLFGIPFQLPLSCKACIVALPRTEIDSLRLGNQERPAVVGILLPLVVGLLLLYLASTGVRD